MQARLAAHDLACRRGDRLLFRGLSFVCEAGGALHVIGANGIGKSSLLRMLAGLLRPFAGAIERDGAVGLLDERLALDEDVPLAVASRFWSALDEAEPDLERWGLDRLKDVPVRYLSTGQRKRAVFSRLSAAASPIWLLDEPLNGLDADAQGVVEGMIAEHRSRGGVCILASHQPVDMQNAQILSLRDYGA